ncbi:MAG: Splicing factor 3B subunit 5 [Marteilia pararefringens]
MLSLGQSGASNRYDSLVQLKHLQARYAGTGHSQMTRHAWLVNVHRSSLASYMQHPDMLSFIAVAENESKERVRLNLLKRMVQPCGKKSFEKDLDDL